MSIRLAENSKELQYYDRLADVFAIVRSLETLEGSYVRDFISPDVYTAGCAKLLSQYRAAASLVDKEYQDIVAFTKKFQLETPAAIERITAGIPATQQHGQSGEMTTSRKDIVETTHFFITAMDVLKLNVRAADAVCPVINDLMNSLNRISSLPADFEGKQKVKEWLIKISKLRAHEELDDADARQLLYDLDAAYNAFHSAMA